jgi:hypothetical protein
MTDVASTFRQCMEEMDAERLEAAWRHIFPHIPVPRSFTQTVIVLHTARTMTENLPLKMRAYSHRWLTDNGYPSHLPDHLKPSAERLFPKISSAVGLSVNTQNEILKPAMPIIRNAMEDAVNEAYADGKKDDTDHIKARIKEARDKAKKQIGLRLSQG